MPPITSVYTASWLYQPGQPPLAGGALAVRNGVICAAGTARELVNTYGAATHEYPDCVLMPGFVNAHTHLELSSFPAWHSRTGLPLCAGSFVDWIIEMIKIKRTLTPDEMLNSLRTGIHQSLQAGTTSVGDIISLPELAAAYQESPLAARLYFELIGQDYALFKPRLQTAITAASDLSGDHKAGLSPHSPYTLNAALLPDIAAAASIKQLPLALHLAESPAESELLAEARGPLADLLYPFVGWQAYLPKPQNITPTRLVAQCNLLTLHTLAVHCVQVTYADALLLQKHGASVCLCPRSNQRLAVGNAPVALFKALKIPLCIGTDSLASNDSLSLWDEIRFALDCYNGELDPAQLLSMATTGGATALGLDRITGSLMPQKRADFQVVELNRSCSPEALLTAGRLLLTVAGGIPHPAPEQTAQRDKAAPTS